MGRWYRNDLPILQKGRHVESAVVQGPSLHYVARAIQEANASGYVGRDQGATDISGCDKLVVTGLGMLVDFSVRLYACKDLRVLVLPFRGQGCIEQIPGIAETPQVLNRSEVGGPFIFENRVGN